MQINILTLFPEYFDSILATSILKRALASGLITVNIINIRDFASDKHQVTDDRPFGGGPGMVMKVEPIYLALESLGQVTSQPGMKRILTSAKGPVFTQAKAGELAKLEQLTLICGHYEGVDERVAENLVDEEMRIGDYVLTGGEPAVAVIIDAVSRLIPGILGNEESNKNESHSQPGKLGFPVYTRPEEFNGWRVPEVLLGGHHAEIQKWREMQSKLSEN
ncbi:MAG TPA: tRNA (guanosine(37)-N1)-methyltransferase TrmD [Vitreimonas sp.]|nr:tRNA (guanosine(37)-N1)-methyltransferase TrmD [Vitreimonas sp.]